MDKMNAGKTKEKAFCKRHFVQCAAKRTDVPSKKKKKIDVLSFEDIENYF